MVVVIHDVFVVVTVDVVVAVVIIQTYLIRLGKIGSVIVLALLLMMLSILKPTGCPNKCVQ